MTTGLTIVWVLTMVIMILCTGVIGVNLKRISDTIRDKKITPDE